MHRFNYKIKLKLFTFPYKCCTIKVVHMSTATRYAGYKTSGFKYVSLPEIRLIKARCSNDLKSLIINDKAFYAVFTKNKRGSSCKPLLMKYILFVSMGIAVNNLRLSIYLLLRPVQEQI